MGRAPDGRARPAGILSEKVAVVGSREGADLGAVESWLRDYLWVEHPDTILVSGGARGVDSCAEATWLELGGTVISLRPKERDPENFVIERWELGSATPSVYVLEGHPTMHDYRSAALYRDILIGEMADRVVSFERPGGSRGAGFTRSWADEALDKPTYRAA